MMTVMLLAAAPAAAPICTDRPTKANSVCTVPGGKLQLEAGVAGWSLTEASGGRSELLTTGTSFAKVGLSNRSDLQFGFTPYSEVTLKQAGERTRVFGFGDLIVRYKQRLSGENAAVQWAAISFVKLPTAANGLGNGKVEGGVAVPISFALAGPVTMTLGPELDLLADADGGGCHPALVNIVNLRRPSLRG